MQMVNQLSFYSQLHICLIGKTITLLIERTPSALLNFSLLSLPLTMPLGQHMSLSGNEKRMVIDRAREEVHQLHLVDPDGTPGATRRSSHC